MIYSFNETTLKYFIVILIIIFVMFAIIISLIAYNRTSVKNMKKENKLLRQQIKEMKAFDKKCRVKFDLIDNKIKMLETIITDKERYEKATSLPSDNKQGE